MFQKLVHSHCAYMKLSSNRMNASVTTVLFLSFNLKCFRSLLILGRVLDNDLCISRMF